VYREYGSGNYRFLAYAGQLVSEAPENAAFKPDNAEIKAVVESLKGDNGQYPYFATSDECEAAGFLAYDGSEDSNGFSSILVVPMRIDNRRRMGAFVIHHKTQNDAYDSLTRRTLDILSDRLARLTQSLHRRRRDELSNTLRNTLLMRLTAINKDNPFTQECEVLTAVAKEIGKWFKHDKIYFLLKNPLDVDTYYLANDPEKKASEEGFIIPNFRLTIPLHSLEGENDTLSQQLFAIVGDATNLKLMGDMKGGKPKYHGDFNSSPQDKFSSISPDCKSWLGVTMHHPDGYVFGYIVLHNVNIVNAYEVGDVRFMDAVGDFTGFLLAAFRTKKKEAVIQKLNETKLAGDKTECEQQLSKIVVDYLLSDYGVEKFSIFAIDSAKQEWRLLWSKSIEISASDPQFQKEVAERANSFRSQPDYDAIDMTLEYGSEKYLITPMRAGGVGDDLVVAGAFVIPAQKHGKVAGRVIDEVSDTLGQRLSSVRNQERYEALTAFTDEVSALSAKNLSKGSILEQARKYISRVMFSDNLYIALYDNEKEEISFPLIYQNGEVWKKMHGQVRKIDKQKLGRTEEIILMKKHLLIKNKADSLKWYAEENHKDHANKPLASWIGVPILSAEGVRGVIATYHDDLDYVYSVRDVFFLKSVAGLVAGLFRVLDLKEANQKLEESITNNTELKEANQKLEEAQANIADQQEFISSFLERSWLKDITKKIFVDLVAVFRRLDFLSKEMQLYNSPNTIEKLSTTIRQGAEKIRNYKDLIEPKQTTSTEVFVPAIINELLYSSKIPNNLQVTHNDSGIEPYRLKIKLDNKSLMQGLFIIFSCLITESERQSDSLSLIIDYDFSDDGRIIIRIFSEAFQHIDTDTFCISRASHILQERLNSNINYQQENNAIDITLHDNQRIRLAMIAIQDDLWRDTLTDLVKDNNIKLMNDKHSLSDDCLERLDLLIMDESSYKLSCDIFNNEKTNVVMVIILDDEFDTYPYPTNFQKIYKADERTLSEEGFAMFLSERGLK